MQKCELCGKNTVEESPEIFMSVGIQALFQAGTDVVPLELKRFNKSYCRSCAEAGRVPFVKSEEINALLKRQ